jgi:hypothetical protein
LIAEDGNPLPGAPRVQSEVFMAAGKTYDVMVNTPVGPTALSPPPSLPVFDRELSLSGNATERDAGMLAYISVNYAALPAAPALGAAQANPDTYSSVIAGQPLTVSDPSKGVIANDVNIYGVKLTGTPVGGSVTLNTNGTFTFSPTAASGSFQYCGNGATSGPACTTVALGAAPIEGKGGIVMNPITYTASTATYLSIAPPGPLAVDKDNAGYPLTVVTPIASASSGVTVTMQPNGGFSATADGTGPVTCPTGAPASSKCYNFTYTAKNSQGSVSDPATVTLVYPQATGLNVVVLDGNDKKTTISDYRWIIEEDRTFYVNPQCTNNPLPGDCPKINTAGTPPSFGTNFHTSWMPVVATGCTGPLSCESGQTVLGVQAVCDVGNGICDTTRTQQTQVYPSQVYLDPTKRYYLSVLPGDAANPFEGGAVGHGMGGAPIACVLGPGETTCTSGDHFPNPITVLSQPTPYPPSKLSVVVFEDDFPLNGEQDNGGGIDVLSPNEPGLGGFNIELFDDAGGTGDATGQMTYDMFNQPLTNSLAGQIDPSTGLDACPLSAQATANPAQQGIVGQITTCPKFESDGKTLSPIAGQAVVANLMPGRFGVVATPGADRVARGEEWLQTNTLDGQKAHDSFLRIGEPAYFQEFGPAGYHVAIGFANPRIINDRHDAVCSGAFGAVGACNNTIDGRVTGIRMSRTPDERLYSSGSRDTFSFTQCYVSLGDPDEEDFMFTKCNADGTFSFSNVPGGSWRLSIFDQWNDQIVDGLSTPTSVSGGTTLHMGDIGIATNRGSRWSRRTFASVMAASPTSITPT